MLVLELKYNDWANCCKRLGVKYISSENSDLHMLNGLFTQLQGEVKMETGV